MAATGAHAAGSLIVDGGFESPNIGNGNYTYPGGVFGAWTYGGSALVNAQSSSAWYGGSAPAGQEALQFAALQGTSSLSQSFIATGSTAVLTWLNAGRPYFGNYNGDQTYEVLLNGAFLGQFSTVSGQAFSQQLLNLSGLTTGSAYTLSYHGLVAADQTAFIDKVSLVSEGVPEPATWALMILGMGLIGATLRDTRRRQVAVAV